MRTLTLAAFVAAASLTSLAHAEGGSAAAAYSTAAAATASVQVQAASMARYKVQPDEFAQYIGRYQLSDGHQLTVSKAAGKFYAQVDDQDRAEILSVSPTSFVGRNANIKLDFTLNFNDAQVTVAPLEG